MEPLETSFGLTIRYTHLALADEFRFVSKKQLEQTKSILVAPASKTMNKTLHDGAAGPWTNEETQQMQAFDWHGTECWTGQTRNTIRN